MTITILPDLVQGSDEWLAQRRGIVTASVVGRLITNTTLKPADNPESRGVVALLTAERITGWTDPVHVTDDMWRGVEDEPRARDTYAEHYAPVTEVGFMVRDDWGFPIGYSPDGLVGDDGLIEIKSRRQKKHLQTILSDQVPPENMAQLQCGLLVSGREWIDYVSYCGGMPLYVSRVYPDREWARAIIGAAVAFEKAVTTMTATFTNRTMGYPVPPRSDLDTEITID